MNNSFDYHKKVDLAKKINKITKKKHLINIFNIISSDNAEFTENDNGVFILFHNLSTETYIKIENYVNDVYFKHNQKKINNELTNNTIENTELSDSNISNASNNKNNNNLSNKEKIIFKRKKYEQYINNNKS